MDLQEIPQIAKTLLRKNKGGELILNNFKSYYKPTVIKTAQYWHKNRRIGQWSRLKNLEINSYIYNRFFFVGQLIFNEGAQTEQQGKNSLFNKCCWDNWISTSYKIDQRPDYKN